MKIKAFGNVETKPIFIGRASNTNNQDYAITGYYLRKWFWRKNGLL